MKIIPFTHRTYLDALADHVVVFDGAMGTSVQACRLGPVDFGGEHLNGCNDNLVITRPDVIEQIHASFLAVGCEAIETDTFRANRITLREYRLQDRISEINQAAASLARRVADRFARETGLPRFVAGSVGPTGMLPSTADPVLGNITFQELVDVFREQCAGLIKGGADLLLIETQQDILETKAAVHGAWRAFEEMGRRIPIQVQITLDTTGRMLLGTDIAAALTTLECLPVVDVIGLNCSTGPDYMREPVRYLAAHARKPISVIPNAGLPLNVDGVAVYPLQPVPLSETLAEFVTELGVNAVGGCCGTTPDHIKEIVDRVHSLKPKQREIEYEPMVSSAMRAIPLHQDPAPLIVGERVNSQGSRRIKKLLLDDDYDGILATARDQVEGGAHMLDVCVALTERSDEAAQMRMVVKKLQMSVEAPLMIDSTEADVIKTALEMNPGRAIINSINLENGRRRCDAVLPLAVAHGAAVIALTIDEQGMAKTADAKLAVARRIYDIAVREYGLSPEALLYDALTFTLATGDPEMAGSAIETMAGIRKIKAELPGVLTSLGVSNVSFGLSPAARAAVNSVFLYHCVQAGLDLALVHPKDITPYPEIDRQVRELCDDLIFNRIPDALPRLIAHFENVQADTTKAVEDPTAGMTVEQKIHWMIVHRKKEGVEPLIDAAIAAHGATLNDGAVWTLNNVLLPAMKEVGDKFGAGELILPFVLQSAEVMKKAVAHLERSLDRKDGATKGKVVLATVYGDVHDIGKSLVNTILSNNGYTVFDLGKQVPANVIIDKAVEVNATAIGLSALLVSTSKQMPLIVDELHKRGLHFPVLIGGAAINRRFGRRILFTESGAPYEAGVFYCKDAFEGLDTMEKLIDPGERGDLVGRIIEEAKVEVGGALASAQRTRDASGVQAQRPTSNIRRLTSQDIPRPPFWGSRVIREMPLEIVLQYLDVDELYRLQWGAKNTHGDEWVKLKADFDARLARMKREALRAGYLKPQAVYGYFPVQSDGAALIVYDPAAEAHEGNGTKARKEIARFEFPRQEGQEYLCLSDYFAPVASGVVDVLALQVVTVGQSASEKFHELQSGGDYSEAYFLHGLGVEAAEATAEYVHQHVRRELGLAPRRGKRYSWGYPACPNLADHQKVFALLPQTKELGLQLSAAFQLIPEQSTAALVVHHPEAKYYSVGVNRVEQLMGN